MLALMLNKRSVQVAKSRPTDWISGFPITNGRLQVRIIICHMKCVHLYCGYNLLNPCPVQIIKNNDLEELQELGSGTFGTVYHGKWRGTDVAIKRINDRCFAGKPSEQEKKQAGDG